MLETVEPSSKEFSKCYNNTVNMKAVKTFIGGRYDPVDLKLLQYQGDVFATALSLYMFVRLSNDTPLAVSDDLLHNTLVVKSNDNQFLYLFMQMSTIKFARFCLHLPTGNFYTSRDSKYLPEELKNDLDYFLNQTILRVIDKDVLTSDFCSNTKNVYKMLRWFIASRAYGILTECPHTVTSIDIGPKLHQLCAYADKYISMLFIAGDVLSLKLEWNCNLLMFYYNKVTKHSQVWGCYEEGLDDLFSTLVGIASEYSLPANDDNGIEQIISVYREKNNINTDSELLIEIIRICSNISSDVTYSKVIAELLE